MVEDDVLASEGMRLALSDVYCDVEIVNVGREAIGKLIHHRPDAIVLDLTLPDIEGVVLATLIRRDWPDLPMILTSGYSHPQGIDRLMDNPQTAFLAKPFEIEDLVSTVQRLVSRRPGARGLRSR